MQRFSEGDRVRVGIPDETDPNHKRYHGVRGTVVAVINDDAGRATGDERDSLLFRVELEEVAWKTFAGTTCIHITGRPTSERSSCIAPDSTSVSDEENQSKFRIPANEEEVIEMAGAETDEEKNLAVTQARLIGDL